MIAVPSRLQALPLGELCDVEGGNSAPQGEQYFASGTVPFVRMRDLGRYRKTTCLNQTDQKVNEDAIRTKRLKIFEPGCILFPRSGSVALNHRAILGTRACIVSHIGILQNFRGNVVPRYLYWFLVSYDMSQIAKQTTNLDLVNFSDIRRIEVPVPPLDEQERVVAEIEKQFTRLDAGVASLKRVQAALKRYRASVLKDACEGQLVPTEAELARNENRSYETGGQLLQRILKERREKWNGKSKYKEPVAPTQPSKVDLPEGWEATFIEPLLSSDRVGIKTGPFGSLLKKYEHRASGVPVLGIENISNMKFAPGNKIFIEKTKADQLAGYDAREGDVLISRSGTVGEVCVIPKGVGAARISSNVMRVLLRATGLLPEFFSILFNGSPTVLRQISQLCSGSTRDFLNQEILRSIVFPLPPLAEQRRIVAEVERRMSIIEELEGATSTELLRAVRLRQAILRAAFSATLA